MKRLDTSLITLSYHGIQLILMNSFLQARMKMRAAILAGNTGTRHNLTPATGAFLMATSLALILLHKTQIQNIFLS